MPDNVSHACPAGWRGKVTKNFLSFFADGLVDIDGCLFILPKNEYAIPASILPLLLSAYPQGQVRV